jgi:hypothetical protein
VGIAVQQWNHEQGDRGKHPHEALHDVEVVVDTKTKKQEWVILNLSVALWHFDIHLFEDGLSKLEFQWWLFFGASLQAWQDVMLLDNFL